MIILIQAIHIWKWLFCVSCVWSDIPNAHGLAVDWVSRNLFWTSYDGNKKQINVARLDGSFKNAVIQGLDKPHCLVLHPILGWAHSCNKHLWHLHTQTCPHVLLPKGREKDAKQDATTCTIVFSCVTGRHHDIEYRLSDIFQLHFFAWKKKNIYNP